MLLLINKFLIFLIFLIFIVFIFNKPNSLNIQMVNEMWQMHGIGYRVIIELATYENLVINAEVIKLNEILGNSGLDKTLQTHLIPLKFFPGEELFSDPKLLAKFEVLFYKKSTFGGFIDSRYVNTGGYFPNDMPTGIGKAGNFLTGTSENLRLFMFIDSIDPIFAQMLCFKYFNISHVQYYYIVHSDSYINASTLFITNNSEIIQKAREFFVENDKDYLGGLGMMQMQGIPILNLLKSGISLG